MGWQAASSFTQVKDPLSLLLQVVREENAFTVCARLIYLFKIDYGGQGSISSLNDILPVPLNLLNKEIWEQSSVVNDENNIQPY
jgi:hypothetical protein